MLIEEIVPDMPCSTSRLRIQVRVIGSPDSNEEKGYRSRRHRSRRIMVIPSTIQADTCGSLRPSQLLMRNCERLVSHLSGVVEGTFPSKSACEWA